MPDIIDPDQFIISRKRKKYRFALFANSPLCFELDEWQQKFRGSPQESAVHFQGLPLDGVVIELGAGTGLFSVELAARHLDQQFVAIDVKADRLQKGARLALERGLTNVKFLRARADQLGELFTENSVVSIWLTFPDPYPKKGSAGRRMTHPTYLRTYTKLLKREGSLYLKHDDPTFFQWSLEQLVATGWRIRELSFDLHKSELSDDYKILTTYEQRWLGEGKPTNFVRATHD